MDKDEEIQDPDYNPEEEVVNTDYKIVDLPEVKVETNEGQEEVIFSAKSKMYRFTDNQWKERGIGELKIVKNKPTSRVRCFLKQEQTFKLRCMFELLAETGESLEKLKTAEKSWMWKCIDFSEGKAKVEKFCARFKTAEDFDKFAEEFKKGVEHNTKTAAEKKPEAPAEKKEEVKEEKKEEEKAE